MTRHKWFKFDAETWLSDPKLNMVSYRAKGIWIHLICLCHLSERYGYLVINKQKMCKETVRKMLKLDRTDTIHLQQLIDYGILRQDEEGFYYCHKLLKDKDLLEKQSEFGRLGGNPSLKGGVKGSLIPESESEREEDKNKNNNNNSLVVVVSSNNHERPTLRQVETFVSENKLIINSVKFWNHYEANGWKTGKNKVENWQALAKSWNEIEKKRGTEGKNDSAKGRPLSRQEKISIALENAKESNNSEDFIGINRE